MLARFVSGQHRSQRPKFATIAHTQIRPTEPTSKGRCIHRIRVIWAGDELGIPTLKHQTTYSSRFNDERLHPTPAPTKPRCSLSCRKMQRYSHNVKTPVPPPAICRTNGGAPRSATDIGCASIVPKRLGALMYTSIPPLAASSPGLRSTSLVYSAPVWRWRRLLPAPVASVDHQQFHTFHL